MIARFYRRHPIPPQLPWEQWLMSPSHPDESRSVSFSTYGGRTMIECSIWASIPAINGHGHISMTAHAKAPTMGAAWEKAFAKLNEEPG